MIEFLEFGVILSGAWLLGAVLYFIFGDIK